MCVAWGLHFLVLVALVTNFDYREMLSKRHALLLALLILIPLAITSSRRWSKRLGKNWRLLHRLVYLADLLAVLHFLLLVKADRRRPLA